MNEKRTIKKIVIYSTLIIVITFLLYYFYLKNISLYNPNKNYTDYWGNYFSVLGTVVAILGSVILFTENEKKKK